MLTALKIVLHEIGKPIIKEIQWIQFYIFHQLVHVEIQPSDLIKCPQVLFRANTLKPRILPISPQYIIQFAFSGALCIICICRKFIILGNVINI